MTTRRASVVDTWTLSGQVLCAVHLQLLGWILAFPLSNIV